METNKILSTEELAETLSEYNSAISELTDVCKASMSKRESILDEVKELTVNGELEYTINGEKRIINGKLFYHPDFFDDGLSYGSFFKDERAFFTEPDAVCYIPEAAFSDVESIEVDNKDFYPADKLTAYTRRDLENLIQSYVDDEELEEDEIAVGDMFGELNWLCPETWLNQLD